MRHPESKAARDAPSRGTLTGRDALEQILGGFLAADGIAPSWLVASETDRGLTLDRLYPELGIAIQFIDALAPFRPEKTPPSEVEALKHRCRRAGISLVQLDPHGDIRDRTLLELRTALSAASRRIAQGHGAPGTKLELLPRIASAKATCQQLLGAEDGAVASQVRRLPVPEAAVLPSLRPKMAISSTFSRVAGYTSVRVVVLFIMVAVAIYLTILVANMGGYVDELIKGNIDHALGLSMMGMPGVTAEEKVKLFEQRQAAAYEAAGLNVPFMVRCFRWLRQGLTLDWGESTSWRVRIRGHYSRNVLDLIRDTLPRSLLIFGTANLFLFFTSLFLALSITRRYGSWRDKIITALSPLSAVPAWTYGVILNIIFLRLMTNLVSGGTFDAWPDEFSLAYIPMILKHMFLPFLAILLSGLFQSVYAWRTFFLLYSTEEHVEMARAKGLSSKMIERRYILRPGLPAVITSFGLMLVALWQEIIALEAFFNVQGIGRLFYQAIRGPNIDMPVVLGLVGAFAYILAITVFILDILYALVDPRVKVGSEGRALKAASRKRKRRFRFWPGRKPASVPVAVSNPHSGVTRSTSEKARAFFSGLMGGLRNSTSALKRALGEIKGYPSAVAGLTIITVLIGISIYTLIALPYDEAVAQWRGEGNRWYRNPTKAAPAWTNLFRKDDLPETIVLNSRDDAQVSRSVKAVTEEMTELTLSFPFDYPYGGFPQDLAVYLSAQYDKKKPLLTLTWLTPDGREFELESISMGPSYKYLLSTEDRLWRKMKEQRPILALFSDPDADAEGPVPLKGTYELRVSALVFEEDVNVDAEFILYGQVFGLAGTDHLRRDLMVGLLWGMPVALAFGILAAVGTSASSIVIAATGAWFGGWVDGLIQRITEVNLILPFLPVSIMVYILYSKSFWAILGVTVLLSVFGSAIKNYRAIFLQIKEAPYIEAARAYGASNRRVVFRYMVPRIAPLLIPQLVILVPGYVFLEATLAFLGVSDPVMPTWGKLIVDALTYGTYSGDYHMVLQPAALLILTASAFLLLGFTLERIFDPRLRET